MENLIKELNENHKGAWILYRHAPCRHCENPCQHGYSLTLVHKAYDYEKIRGENLKVIFEKMIKRSQKK